MPRPSANGYKVGPLFADTAARLLAGLAAAVPGRPYCIDMPGPDAQPAGPGLVRASGPTEAFRTARTYTGAVPPFDRVRVLGIDSPELG